MAIKHGVCDTDTHFTIDPITRVAKNDGLKKVCIVRDDHNSEVCTFELPRYVEGHDMAQCNRVEVHYLNTDSTTKAKSTGVYVATDFGISEEDPEKVTLTWLISSAATKYPGQLAFALHFACIDDLTDDVRYWWSSATNTSISVLDSINNSEAGGAGEVSDLQDKTVTPSSDIQVIRPDGEYRGLSKVVVEPIPEEYVAPSGSLFVDANGEYEIREYATIMVNVPPAVQEKEVTANGTYTPGIGFDGFSKVVVNVPDAPAVLQEKQVYPSTSDQDVEPDEEFDGLSRVTVRGMRLQDKSVKITQNGETEVIADSGFDGLESVKFSVDVEGSQTGGTGNLQEKTITTNGDHAPGEGFDGFSKVKVKVPQVVYTGVAVVGDSVPVYGGIKEQFVAQGMVVFPMGGTAPNGVGIPVTGNAYTTYDSTAASPYLDWHTDVTFLTGVYDTGYGMLSRLYFKQTGSTQSGGSSAVQYTHTHVLADGTENNFGTYTNYHGYLDYGFAFVWDNVQGPGAVYKGVTFEFGYAACACLRRYMNSDGQVVVSIGGVSYYLPFASEAEYNAALNLVYKPTTLVQINEKVIDYTSEGNEA